MKYQMNLNGSDTYKDICLRYQNINNKNGNET